MWHMTTNTWKRCPSVTTGGKRYFWTRECIDSSTYRRVWVVWHRDARAYGVDVERRVFHSPRPETLIFTSTPQQGKRYADRHLA